MSRPQEALPAKLIAGLLFRHYPIRNEALSALTARFGPLDFLTEPKPFTYTSYYDEEMGGSPLRQVVSFLRLVGADALPEIKHFTNSIESQLSEGDARRLNVDPGLLNEERLVLATGKNFTHRIYLRSGIYADLTLIFQKGAYHVLPWTYPDYQDSLLLHFLSVLRQKLIYQRSGRLPRKAAGRKGEML